ncbi:MAG: hypothetical protein IJ083_08580 [Clostridia bacterium]|nr:hypothetical protein [Clostridia bacterium]
MKKLNYRMEYVKLYDKMAEKLTSRFLDFEDRGRLITVICQYMKDGQIDEDILSNSGVGMAWADFETVLECAYEKSVINSNNRLGIPNAPKAQAIPGEAAPFAEPAGAIDAVCGQIPETLQFTQVPESDVMTCTALPADACGQAFQVSRVAEPAVTPSFPTHSAVCASDGVYVPKLSPAYQPTAPVPASDTPCPSAAPRVCHSLTPLSPGATQQHLQRPLPAAAPGKDSGQAPAYLTPPDIHFVTPTLEDVNRYIQEHHYRISALKFIAYYSSVGWKRGSTPIIAWQPMVDLWNLREADFEKHHAFTPLGQGPKQVMEQMYEQRPNTEPDGSEVPEWIRKIAEAQEQQRLEAEEAAASVQAASA